MSREDSFVSQLIVEDSLSLLCAFLTSLRSREVERQLVVSSDGSLKDAGEVVVRTKSVRSPLRISISAADDLHLRRWGPERRKLTLRRGTPGFIVMDSLYASLEALHLTMLQLSELLLQGREGCVAVAQSSEVGGESELRVRVLLLPPQEGASHRFRTQLHREELQGVVYRRVDRTHGSFLLMVVE
jgi:hypothetical protein